MIIPYETISNFGGYCVFFVGAVRVVYTNGYSSVIHMKPLAFRAFSSRAMESCMFTFPVYVSSNKTRWLLNK